MLDLTQISFLRAVLIHACTAFGGPQGHYSLMLKTFVEKRKDITEKELLNYNSFCQLLPGASSTQILVLIGYKKGGLLLAFLTLLVWVLPAAIIMGSIAIIITDHQQNDFISSIIRYLPPLAVGFISYASWKSLQLVSNKRISIYITLSISIICFILFKLPIVFPLVLIIGSLSNYIFSTTTTSELSYSYSRIRWKFLSLFISIFVLSGLLSESARKANWSQRPYFNLFENGYRFGSITFGGGDVLIPLMYEQYVARPSSKRIKEKNSNALKIDRNLFLSGAGLMRAIPGPVFSFSSFAGASVLSSKGFIHQCLGVIVATSAIFLPSFLLVLFFLPLWEYLHRYQFLYQLLEGVQAATVGIMCASVLYLSKDLFIVHYESFQHTTVSLAIITSTFFFLHKTSFHPAWLALACMVMGYFFS